MLRRIKLGLLAGLALALVPGPVTAANPPLATDSFNRLMREAGIALLREGNSRFVAARSEHPNLDADRRRSTVSEGQEPFASILSCSDSRVPLELLFDRGVGDLFVIRVAGNIAGTSELASLEYGVTHLHTPLLIVLGHTKCGAVTAVAQGAELHGHLPALAAKIQPAVIKAKGETKTPEDLVPRAIEQNVWQAIADILRESRGIRDLLISRQVIVLGAVYNLETGEVTWLGPHPQQSELLEAADAVVESKPHDAHAKAVNRAPPPQSGTPTNAVVPLPASSSTAVVSTNASAAVAPIVDPLESLRREPIQRPPSHSTRSF